MLLSVRRVVEAELPAVERHVPFGILKQPPDSWMPFANVDEADAPVMFRYVEEIPLVNVEVALPCTMRVPVVVAPPKIVRPVVVEPPPIVEEARE